MVDWNTKRFDGEPPVSYAPRPAKRYDPNEPRIPAGKGGGQWTVGGAPVAAPGNEPIKPEIVGPLEVPTDPLAYPGGYNPNDTAAGALTPNDKLYWVAASRARLQAIRDNQLVPGTIGNKMLMNMMLDAPPTAAPIYRGVRMEAAADNPAYNPLSFTQGSVVDLGLTSFATDKGEALLYARSSLGRTGESTDKAFVGDAGKQSTLLKVEPGAAGLNIGPTFKGNPGDEVISAGRYEVVRADYERASVTTPGFDEDVVLSGLIRVVTLRQTAVIDAQSGKPWATDSWSDMASTNRKP